MEVEEVLEQEDTYEYRDRGCKYGRLCLSCPYPLCLLEMGIKQRNLLLSSCQQVVANLCGTIWSRMAIAEHMGIRERQLYKLFKEGTCH